MSWLTKPPILFRSVNWWQHRLGVKSFVPPWGDKWRVGLSVVPFIILHVICWLQRGLWSFQMLDLLYRKQKLQNIHYWLRLCMFLFDRYTSVVIHGGNVLSLIESENFILEIGLQCSIARSYVETYLCIGCQGFRHFLLILIICFRIKMASKCTWE